jgi:chemotaxis protein MotB
MAKREKKDSGGGGEGVPAWMVTFSDLMTLLLTFFVLLLSMASMTDERRLKEALGSVFGSFGFGTSGYNPLTTTPRQDAFEPGPINDVRDLEPIKPLLWEDPSLDLRFEWNRFLQRVGIGADTLFAPGSADITPEGAALLRRLAPVVRQSEYPVAIFGHTGLLRDEQGEQYRPFAGTLDASWELSLRRAQAVAEFFAAQGVPREKMRVEAHGRFRPRTTNETPEGRRENRRVEIVLDRRVGDWSPQLALTAPDGGHENERQETFRYKDFLFRLDR